MKLLSDRLIADIRKREPERTSSEADFAGVNCWLDEEQWLAGFPAGTSEMFVWSWWRPQNG